MYKGQLRINFHRSFWIWTINIFI